MPDYNFSTPWDKNQNQLAGAPNAGVSGLDIGKLLGQLGMSAGTGALMGGPAGAGMGTISGLINMIPSIFKGIYGASQLHKADLLERQNPRPNAEVAPAISKLAGYTYGQTLNQDIPGGEMYRNEIKGATSAGMNAASQLSSGSEAYGMLGKLMGGQNNAMGQLAQTTAQDVAGKQGAYEGALGQLGQEQNRVWDWNKAQPYLQAAQIASQLRGSGMQNVFGGVSGAAGAGAEMTSPDFNSAINSGRGYGGQGGNIDSATLMKILNTLK